ncbi:MAG: ammonium transporter [Acidobacteria bacterium]|nr:ammonium transporter [Acidobacteriota bacterium]
MSWKRLLGLAAAVAVAHPLVAQGTAPVNDSGATAWLLTSTTLVLLMVPGLALFYGGLVLTKNVLGTMMHSFAAMAVVGVLWAVLGYALSFGPNALGGLIGWRKDLILLRGIDQTILPAGVPEYAFAMFQGKFAIITPALIAGAVAERISFRGWLAFITLWIIFVYCPLCHWVWASDGYFFNLGAKGAIDFAGGTVVHISSGVGGLALAVGWFGFNAGSSVASNLDTARALTVTQVAAAAGALTWILIETIRDEKPTSLGMASGILAGLVVITPAAGVVQVGGALALGVIAACCCYSMILLKNRLGYDDSLDAFGIHGTGGIVGAIGLTFFIRDAWWAEAAAKVPGWGILAQLRVQGFAVLCTILFSVVMTLIIAALVQKFIGFRVSEAVEKTGLDHELHGERAYGLNNLN